MSRSLRLDNPVILSAFHASLYHQLLVIGGIALVLLVGWNVAFTLQQRRLAAASAGRELAVGPGAAALDASALRRPVPEPPGRRVLRIGFGALWIVDGLLQVQNGMPVGLPQNVLRPAADGSPGWVHAVVNLGATIWQDHPVQAATSAVWLQLGIGLALLAAPRGMWSRAAAALSTGWALVVWVFGEAFGGIFAHGVTWAFGAPGAVLFYAAGGVLLVVPETAWRGRTLGRLTTAVLGLYFAGMALLQAWPGRGLWQGGIGAHAGLLESMVRSMSQTPQPAVLSGWLSAFAGFDAAHGWAVNLFLVVVLAAIGASLLSGRDRLVVAGAAAAAVVCLADWVLVQDVGVLGGTGTDPNSMVPTLLLLAGAVVALRSAPAEVTEPALARAGGAADDAGARGRWTALAPTTLARVGAAVLGFAVVAVGVVPMASAATNPNADPIVAEAVDGSPSLVDSPAPPFTLTDQAGADVSLASLRGKTVALTFLDPVCTSDCPIIAQSFRQADGMLGPLARKAVFVAIVANPLYRSRAAVDAFDRQEHLSKVDNWLFLTGSLAELTKVWNAYGVQVAISPAGAMVAHSEVAFIIDGRGRTRAILDSTPGTSAASHSSFSSLVADQVRTFAGR